MKFWIVILAFIFAENELIYQSFRFVPKYETTLHVANSIGIHQCSRSLPKNIRKLEPIKGDELKGLHDNMLLIQRLTESVKGKPRFKVDSLGNFGFQFIGLRINGKKYIYCNAFRLEGNSDPGERYGDWRTELVDICDGGHDYWGVLYDIKGHQFKDLVFNGGG